MSSERPGVISFDDALSRARRHYRSVDSDGVRETGTYWFIPVEQIGCHGVVVDKASGDTTELGSAWDVETWLWGYEKGLVARDPVDLVVVEVIDLEKAAAILERLGISHPEGRRAVLRKPPVVFERAVTWTALGELAADRERAFRWEVR